jgi:PKD repeat protein
MNPQPVSGFSVLNPGGCVPYTLQLTNSSQYADLYQWYVNDEPVSDKQQPDDIVLTKPDESYKISLVANNIYGCQAKAMDIQVSTAPKPVAAFEVTDTLSCSGVLDMRALNTSSGARSYEWYFGDLSIVEYTATPKRHIYAQPGEYDMRLVADNGICKDTAYRIMRVGIKPTALFEVDTALGCGQMEVNFRNLSSEGQAYLWDFGDGTFSGQANPRHGFAHVNSPYTITLIASGSYGCADTTTRLNLIRLMTPPVASFRVLPSTTIELPQYTFQFFDQSTDLKTPEYKWSFGDGIGRSTDPGPSYTYADTGIYNVQLIVTNKEDQCSDTATQKVTILGMPGWLYVPNAFQPGSGRSELKKFLPKGTGLKTYRLRIFNSWGEMVFETTKLDDKGKPTEGWDGIVKGKLVQQDVYVWKIEAVFLSGQEWQGMKYPGTDYKKVGTITVIK